MADVSPVIRRAMGGNPLVCDPSAISAPLSPVREPLSGGRPEGNVTSGGEPKTIRILTGVESLEAELFENKTEIKLLTSQVAMHLTVSQRNILFTTIDRLLSVENWEEESSKIDIESFRSFLRCIIYAHPHRMPNMGVSPTGSVLAAWHFEEKRVQAEFLPKDQCIILIGIRSIRGPERIAWRGHIARLRSVVENNDAGDCINR